jgi:hypothetical protein
MTDEQTTCNPWLVIGGSARCATQATGAYFNSPRGTKIITAARGILVARAQGIHPDYHLIYSAWAAQAYMLAYKTAQRQGTKIIACDWHGEDEPRNATEVEVGKPKDDYADPAYVFPVEVVVSVAMNQMIEDAEPPNWSPGQPLVSQSDGLIALQFALDDGADTVNLAGFEGFTNSARPYLDGPNLGDDTMAKMFFNCVYRPTLWNIITSCPDTTFTMYGTPTYDFPDIPDNLSIVEVARSPAPLEATVADPGEQPERT